MTFEALLAGGVHRLESTLVDTRDTHRTEAQDATDCKGRDVGLYCLTSGYNLSLPVPTSYIRYHRYLRTFFHDSQHLQHQAKHQNRHQQ